MFHNKYLLNCPFSLQFLLKTNWHRCLKQFFMVTDICCDCDALENLTKTTCTNTTKVVPVANPVTNIGKSRYVSINIFC